LNEIILQTIELSKSYGGIKVLNGINFDVRRGEVHGLVGENGAGKTTLIKIIAGVEKPDDGSRLLFDGKPVEKLTPLKTIQRGISVIYQDISLFPNLSIAENICPGGNAGPFVNWERMSLTAADALKKVGCEDINPSEILGDISVGKQQLVALARAVTLRSKVIIMDEPSAALSATEVQMLYRTIRTLKQEGISLIYISHKLDEVLAVADRVTVLRDGEMIATRPAAELDSQSLIGMMVGRKLQSSVSRYKGDTEEKIFQVDGLTREPLFRNISFCLYRNEILGITGLVGARRTEVAQALFGLLKLDKGSVIMNGKPIFVRSPNDAIKKGICYLPEDRRDQGIFLQQSMARNITAANIGKTLNRLGLISAAKEQLLARQYIDTLDIKPAIPGIKMENMSGGNQQKTLFGRWLSASPLLLIADEPTSGVDVGAKAEIHRLLRELALSGVGVILISSDLPEVLTVSDRILVMRAGRIVAEVDASTATQEDIITKGLMG
jgi:ABC-type sugar transport system ATPase subunit